MISKEIWVQAYLRAVTGFTIILCSKFLPYHVFSSILITISFSHYFMSLYYSRRRITEIYSNLPHNQLKLLLLLAFAFGAAIYDQPNMVFVFWLHHVWNEVYIMDEKVHLPDSAFRNGMLWRRFLFESAVYFSVARNSLNYWAHIPISAFWLSVILVLTFINYVAFTWSNKQLLRSTKTADFLFSSLGLVFGIISLESIGGTVDHPLFYHFIFWTMYPFSSFLKNRGSAQKRYILETMISILIFLPITPMIALGDFSDDTLNRWVRISGYIHIVTSLALSRYHPRFIQKIFSIQSKSSMKEAL